jgi:hypothetical protein
MKEDMIYDQVIKTGEYKKMTTNELVKVASLLKDGGGGGDIKIHEFLARERNIQYSYSYLADAYRRDAARLMNQNSDYYKK